MNSFVGEHNLHIANNPGECSPSDEGTHGGELIGFHSNLNSKSIDKRLLNRIETETGSHIRLAAGIVRVKTFRFSC